MNERLAYDYYNVIAQSQNHENVMAFSIQMAHPNLASSSFPAVS